MQEMRKTRFRRFWSTLALLLLVFGFASISFAGAPLKDQFDAIKNNAQQAVTLLKEGDYAGAAAILEELDASLEDKYTLLTKTPLMLAKHIPVYGEDVETAIQYLELWREVYPKIIVPALEKVQEIGLPDRDFLHTDSTVLSKQMIAYTDLFEVIYPDLQSAVKKFSKMPEIHISGVSEKIERYRVLSGELDDLLPELKKLADELIRPAADMLKRYPLSSIKAQNGINIRPVIQYLAFYTQVRPVTIELTDAFSCTDLSSVSSELQEKLLAGIDTVRALTERADKYVPVAQAILGSGQDQRFLIVAQNTAEIRAGGGFPGAVCVASIKDGNVSIDDFVSGWDLLPLRYARGFGPDANEIALFGGWFSGQLKDASFNPHFPMVAKAWAAGHSTWYGLPVDGIISATPHIVQELLEICGPITLSNGTVLSSDYCMEYLQHDVYYQYLGRGTTTTDEVVDALFAETAKTVVESMKEKLSDQLSLHDIEEILDFVDKSFANRTLMMWMEDENAERQIMDIGWSGALNFNKQKPEIGVYFSIADSNKVGYFLNIEASCDYSAVMWNEDGSASWPVSVRLTNMLTQEDLKNGSGNRYRLLGSHGGDFASKVYFFAPVGGRIEDISYEILNSGFQGYRAIFSGFREGGYQGLQVFYNGDFMMHPGEVIEITFIATTAPGVSVSPTFSMTPVSTLKY